MKDDTWKRVKLMEFVRRQHVGQLRKYTGSPYVNHLRRVAFTVLPLHAEELCVFEIAWCHDLFEDTSCNSQELYKALETFEYTENERWTIIRGVNQLTNYYTKEQFPDLNRETRKRFEADRLRHAEGHVQTVKYADLIDNATSIKKYDPKFFQVFSNEAFYMLSLMDRGNEALRREAKLAMI